MGLRLWIKTKNEPEFPLRVQWQFLNQALEIDGEKWWFFQDEWESDFTLYMCAGLTKTDPNGTLQKMYYKKHMELINILCNVTSNDIDTYFVGAWERPLPFWDNYRTLMISYIEAKRDYLTALKNASIIDTKSAFDDIDIILSDSKFPAWYELKYNGPERRLPRIPGKVIQTDKSGNLLI